MSSQMQRYVAWRLRDSHSQTNVMTAVAIIVAPIITATSIARGDSTGIAIAFAILAYALGRFFWAWASFSTTPPAGKRSGPPPWRG